MNLLHTSRTLARTALFAAALGITHSMPLPVCAQASPDDATRAVARDLGAQGIDAYRANNFADADAKLERAYRLFSTPTLGLWSARTRVQLGRWVEAAERYRETMRVSAAVGNNETQVQAQQDAGKELAELLPRIPTLTVQVENAESSEVKLTLDGVALHQDMIGIARPTNVGSHTVVAIRGNERSELKVQLAEKDKKVLPVRFTAPAGQASAVVPPHTAPAGLPVNAAPPSPATQPETLQPVAAAEQTSAPAEALTSSGPLKPIAVVALGIGAAGLATWGVGALIADGKLDDCPVEKGEPTCANQDQADSFNAWKTTSTVGFYTGTAFALIGLGTWLYASSSEQPSQGLTWELGPTSASVRGTF